ncbi:hypothetical protein DICVIV_00199 [Dictyocaulus viviparus]|uniref:Uncharacterized protein n=1 Tax=Dictyocaulus viviparus TaxID=29172 RepID=A0A0D8YAK5_DICVI|nr:hypothetical protein DICVIV_00199 [Dictyocaulus viviparus]
MTSMEQNRFDLNIRIVLNQVLHYAHVLVLIPLDRMLCSVDEHVRCCCSPFITSSKSSSSCSQLLKISNKCLLIDLTRYHESLFVFR